MAPLTYVMVDIMATQEQFTTKEEDFEDGELPEDGEIQDDDEAMNVDVKPSVPSRSSPVCSSSPTPAKPKESGSPPVRRATAPRGYGDDIDGLVKREVWNKEADSTAEYGGGEDKDYRFDEESYGDFDYRQGPPASRRRRHSPTEEDFDPRAKRPFGRGPWRPYRKPKWATEHQICKFFREGFCRDGDECTYSHQAEDSLRKPELCRFYQNGFCKKGLTCLALHGEFPCKAFHKGECNSEPCHYSHQPLTDYTRPIYERMVQHEEDAALPSRQAPPQHYPPAGPPLPPPPRRRVLLPGGPVPQHMPPAIHAPIPPAVNNGILAPPAVVVPTLATMQAQSSPHHPHSHPPYHMPPQLPPRSGYYPPTHASSPLGHEDAKPQPAPAAQFDITQMLAQIAGEASAEQNDSPASPPLFGSTDTDVRAIPDSMEVPWRLVPLEKVAAYAGLDPSITTSNDPRMNRMISSQFDAVSSLFASAGGSDIVPSDAISSSVRDPRRRPSDDKPRASSWMPQIA